jgi:hypothetical protein
MRNRNLKQIIYTLLLAAAFSMPACSSSDSSNSIGDTTAVKDNTADFSKYKTFFLVEPPDDVEQPGDITEGVRLSVINALTKELKSAGLKEAANAEAADLKVTSFIKVKTVDATATGYWYEYYYWGWYWDYYDYWYENDEIEFDMGTLIVDVVDSTGSDDADDRLVFRGVSMGIIADNPSDAPERVEDAIEEIFSYWPDK